MTAEEILLDLLAYLRRWENTDSDKESDFDAVRAVFDARRKLLKLNYRDSD